MDQKNEFNPSDKKKLLALPFLLAKRSALPEPRYGQKEWSLFEKMYGRAWNAMDDVIFDEEEKITEYNYEEHIPKHLLKGIDTNSEDFKRAIKMANYNSKTKYEQHKADQKEFQKLMPTLASLDEEETEIFLHLIRNKGRDQSLSKQISLSLIDEACDDSEKAELARISEEENFALKARYKHDNDTAQWMDAKRMPVDETKVRDLLRYQHHFRAKILDEMNVYGEDKKQQQFERGLLTYVNEASWGDLKELLQDVGINRHSINFFNVGDIIKANSNTIHDSDKNWKYIE